MSDNVPTQSGITRLLVYDGVGETIALGLTNEDYPAALFIERWHERGKRAYFGLETEGIVQEIARDQGGAYVDLATGETAFLSLKPGTDCIRGERIAVRVASEAYQDKLARIVRRPPDAKSTTAKPPSPPTAFEAWCRSVNLPEEISREETLDVDQIEDALEAATADTAMIDNGGRLQFGHTAALTAVDIDSGGRHSKGSPESRAIAVNSDAIQTAMRELTLRSIGGIVVLDCVGPIRRAQGERLKDLAISARRRFMKGRMQIFAPSPLGLMEMSFARTTASIRDRLLDSARSIERADTVALKAFRKLEQEARQNRTASLSLDLPPPAFHWHRAHEKIHMEAFQARYGARISIQERNPKD